jgi:hypothetical protein
LGCCPISWDFISSGLIVLGGYLGTDAAARYFEHAARVHPEQFLYLSDLTDLSVAENRILIPAPFLNGNDLSIIKKHYRFPEVTGVFWGEPKGEMIKFGSTRPEEVSDLRRAWIHEVWNNPGRCLQYRYGILERYLRDGLYYQSGIDPNDAGLFIYHKRANDLLLKYLAAFLHGPLQRHFISFLGCPVLVALLLRYWASHDKSQIVNDGIGLRLLLSTFIQHSWLAPAFSLWLCGSGDLLGRLLYCCWRFGGFGDQAQTEPGNCQTGAWRLSVVFLV